jgi:hypothetical protein
MQPWDEWHALQKRSKRSHVAGDLHLSILNVPPEVRPPPPSNTRTASDARTPPLVHGPAARTGATSSSRTLWAAAHALLLGHCSLWPMPVCVLCCAPALTGCVMGGGWWVWAGDLARDSRRDACDGGRGVGGRACAVLVPPPLAHERRLSAGGAWRPHGHAQRRIPAHPARVRHPLSRQPRLPGRRVRAPVHKSTPCVPTL